MATNKTESVDLKNGGFIPVETSEEIIKAVQRESALLSLANVQSMSAPTKRFPVQVNEAGAYWVGEGEKIGTAKGSWITVELVAKKLGVIVPVTKEALNDSTIDIFEEYKEQIQSAFSKKLDAAGLFGTESPYGTGKSVYEMAKAKSATVTAGADLVDDISEIMAKVEEKNLDVNAFVVPVSMKNKLRKLKDGDGTRLYKDVTKEEPAELFNQPLFISRNGAFDTTKAEVIAGNFDYLHVGIMQDIEYAISEHATVGDLNLFEQDMVGLKVTMRVGFLVIKDDAFAVLEPSL